MKKLVSQLVALEQESVVRYFRQLHAHPELSFQEYQTASFVASELAGMGISYRAQVAGTGIVARIDGARPGKVVALRADMDALPVSEATNLPWCSVNENVMHACGHDAHTACLLSVARILDQLKNEWEGTVLLIFQPGEEKAPGGARLMLEDGIFETIQPDLIIGQHVSVDYPTGTMGFRPGIIMASADEIHIKIKGQGGHGALPHLTNDTVLAAAQVLVALQQVRSRLCPPLVPMVLSFGKLIADGATNVIPHEVMLSGTLRTFNEGWRQEAKGHICRIINEVSMAHGCVAEINIPEGYPCVNNNEKLTTDARKYAAEWVGEENVRTLEVRMTSEDFGFFSQQYPSVFYRFGVKGVTNADCGGLHSADFQIDEEALKTGVGGMVWLALNFLKK